ncbi:hypothetical protein [Novosphingobium sp.]|uniref:hypothetical protein n=1 Tax=Novosphingobium sp. TaxID=1874826 RepID=UPI00286E81F7|nr:hypothetical protein [Novosphingobium sp.]
MSTPKSCATCSHYLTPDRLSGPCAMGGIPALRGLKNLTYTTPNEIVYSRNSCGDWASAPALQVAA